MKNGIRKTAGILGIVLGTGLVYNTANANHLIMEYYIKCFNNEKHGTITTNRKYQKGEVIVKFRPTQLYPEEAEYFIKSIGYERKKELDPRWIWIIKVSEGKELEVIEKFKAECLSDIIDNAEPNYNLELRGLPDILLSPPGKGVESPK